MGDDITVKKNFEGIEEKIVGCLNKWKFLLSNMSVNELLPLFFKNSEGLGLDKSLFWMNLKKFSVSKLPIFKSQSLFKVLRSEKTGSLYWILQLWMCQMKDVFLF